VQEVRGSCSKAARQQAPSWHQHDATYEGSSPVACPRACLPSSAHPDLNQPSLPRLSQLLAALHVPAAPVSGGVPGAQAGSLTFMVGRWCALLRRKVWKFGWGCAKQRAT